jgi:hypothetical protein
MVHLGTEPDRAVCEIAKVGNRRIVQFSRVPPGAVGYLISHAGAKKLLQAEPRVWPIDTDTRRPWVFGLAVYGVVSPPIRHNWSILSTIRARVQAAHVAPWIACRIRQPDPQFGRVLVQLGAAGTGAMVALPDRQQRLEDPRRSQARQLKQFRDQKRLRTQHGPTPVLKAPNGWGDESAVAADGSPKSPGRRRSQLRRYSASHRPVSFVSLLTGLA